MNLRGRAKRLRAATLVAASGALAIGCLEDVGVTSRLPGGARPRRIALLGVYENGRMASYAEGAPFTRWLDEAGSPCAAAYGPALFASHPDLSAAIDDYAQVHGPSADLLARLAPAARGDAILVVVLSSHAPEVHVDVKGNPDRELEAAGASLAASVAGGPVPSRSGRSSIRVEHDPTVQAEALLYDVATRRWLGSVAIDYAGAHPDKAMTRFQQELAERLHGARCGAWDWSAPIDTGALALEAKASR